MFRFVLFLVVFGACTAPHKPLDARPLLASPPDDEKIPDKTDDDAISSGQLEQGIDRFLWKVTGGVPDESGQSSIGETKRRKGDKKGEFFVAPVPFRNPQIGWGLMVLSGYIFRLDKENPDTPPSVAGAGGFYTENDSWGAFAGGKFFTRDDTWRLSAGAFTGRINYDFYGVGTDPGDSDFSLPFRAEFGGVLIEAMRKIVPDLYGGLRWTLGHSETTIRNGLAIPPELRPPAFDADISAPGLLLQYDTRDNNFYPTKGMLADARALFHSPSVGDTFEYQVYELAFRHYPSLDDKTVLAWRAWDASPTARSRSTGCRTTTRARTSAAATGTAR